MILLYTVLLLAFIKYLWDHRTFYWASWHIDGPLALPLLGNGHMVYNMDKIFGFFKRLRKYKKPLIRLWLGPRLFVFTEYPEMIEAILNHPSCIDKGKSYRFLTIAIGGEGLITLKTDGWKVHRKLLNPSFNYNIIHSYVAQFNENCDKLVKSLEKHADGKPFEIYEPLKAFSLELLFDTTINYATEDKQRFLHCTHNSQVVTARRMFQFWLQPDILFRLSKLCKLQKNWVGFMLTTVEKILTEKKTALEVKLSQTDNSETSNLLIDKIITLERNNLLDHKEAIAELNTVLLAGYETTAVSIAYNCLALALHPECQQRLFEEIKSVFPDQNSFITVDQMKDLPYMDLVMKETNRIFPPVPFLTRLANEDIYLGDTYIPKGTEFIIGIYYAHRNKQFMTNIENPEQFNPENFLPENVDERNPYSYIPFSAGQRNCIGMKYAQIATKMALLNIVRNYRLSTDLKMDKLRFRMHITLQLIGGYLIKLEKREQY